MPRRAGHGSVPGNDPPWNGELVRIPPPFLALGAAVAQRALSRGAAPLTVRRATGAAALMVASAGLLSGALRLFRRHKTTVDPLNPADATTLVTDGPNALTRNPMYIGMVGVLVGHAILRGRWAALLPVAAFVVAIDRWQIAAEERALLERFGPEYEAYRAQAPRWVGRRSISRRLDS